ncbi:hypothetical protein B9Z55_012829 [Caenorhabditis nigoni]|nr:hypothetical protein B9Z55_012829 [Caenorhabditis nigoni]
MLSQNTAFFNNNSVLEFLKTTMFQTLIPITFLFFPIGILFSAPLFGFDLERWSYFVTFFYSFYPVVDPISAIFFIDEYRTAFLNFFRRTLNRNQVTPVKSIDIVPELP